MLKQSIQVLGQSYHVDCPDKCPICHSYCQVELIGASAISINKEVRVIYKCTMQNCGDVFIAYYGKFPRPAILSIIPQKSELIEKTEEILSISPSFFSIFEEAETARNNGLNQIAGPGYRKAFEFLIKDYAISKDPDNENSIKEKFSGKVVNEYIEDPRIKAMSKRALWLGNDETHYLRKWESHNIQDLINLITLTIKWLEIEQLSTQYEEEMPE